MKVIEIVNKEVGNSSISQTQGVYLRETGSSISQTQGGVSERHTQKTLIQNTSNTKDINTIKNNKKIKT